MGIETHTNRAAALVIFVFAILGPAGGAAAAESVELTNAQRQDIRAAIFDVAYYPSSARILNLAAVAGRANDYRVCGEIKEIGYPPEPFIAAILPTGGVVVLEIGKTDNSAHAVKTVCRNKGVHVKGWPAPPNRTKFSVDEIERVIGETRPAE